MALFHCDADDDSVAENSRAARDCAAVAAALADDRGGFSGNGGFINAGNAFHHIAVSGDHVTHLAQDEITLVQIRSGNLFLKAIAQASGHRVLARFPQAGGLGFAPAFGHSFSEVGEEDGEPEPDGQLSDEAALG